LAVPAQTLSIRDAITDIVAASQLSRTASRAAVQQVWHAVESSLGVEVAFEDPALRELFAVHVLAVEELCLRIRAQAVSLCAAVDTFARSPFGELIDGLRTMRVVTSAPRPPGASASSLPEALETEIGLSSRANVDSVERLRERTQREVIDVIEQRFRTHAALREDVRERERWHTVAQKTRQDLASLRRPPVEPGDRVRGVHPTDEAEHRHREALDHVRVIDEQMLATLLDLQASSVDAVKGPWAALLHLQADFFVAQQSTWTPLADVFEECAEVPPDGFSAAAV
jgi:hypothetical protein